jgi:F-type H+-transporting ATPase subunit c
MYKILFSLIAFVAAGAVFAQDGATLIQMNEYTKAPLYFLAVAIAAYGGTRAQSNAASVALEGMARNPSAADKLFVPMILGLALMESLVIFTLITIFLA